MANESIKSAVESLLFVWGDPLEAKACAELFNLPTADMIRIMRDLMQDYEERGGGIRIREVGKAYQFYTIPENDDYIQKLVTPVRTRRLSQAALEVLAVIAYKQPVTKSQIDGVRGIKSDRVIEGLLAKGMIEEKGRSNAIGRPIIYGTTRKFLEVFGFESLKDLPEIDDVETLILGGEEGYDGPAQMSEELKDQIAMDLDEDQ
jgi:segregation and condensation protein B